MYQGMKAQKPMFENTSNPALVANAIESLHEQRIIDFLIENAKFSKLSEASNDVINTFQLNFKKNDFNPELSALLYEKGKEIFKPLKRANYSHVTEEFNMQVMVSSKAIGDISDPDVKQIKMDKLKGFMINRVVETMRHHLEKEFGNQFKNNLSFNTSKERQESIINKIREKNVESSKDSSMSIN